MLFRALSTVFLSYPSTISASDASERFELFWWGTSIEIPASELVPEVETKSFAILSLSSRTILAAVFFPIFCAFEMLLICYISITA